MPVKMEVMVLRIEPRMDSAELTTDGILVVLVGEVEGDVMWL